jgi:hypothetical protein
MGNGEKNDMKKYLLDNTVGNQKVRIKQKIQKLYPKRHRSSSEPKPKLNRS